MYGVSTRVNTTASISTKPILDSLQMLSEGSLSCSSKLDSDPLTHFKGCWGTLTSICEWWWWGGGGGGGGGVGGWVGGGGVGGGVVVVVGWWWW